MKTVTGRSSGGRSSPQLVTENERPYPWRQIAGIAAGKTLMRGSFALVSICMNEILLDIYGGNLTAVARYGSAISSVNTLVSFFMQPLSGALMDKYGRKPFLVCGGILAGILRGQVGLNPSSLSYTLYRLFLPVFYAPFFPAYADFMTMQSELRRSPAVPNPTRPFTNTQLKVTMKLGTRKHTHTHIPDE